MWCTGAICNQVYLASLCVVLLQPLICRIQSNAYGCQCIRIIMFLLLNICWVRSTEILDIDQSNIVVQVIMLQCSYSALFIWKQHFNLQMVQQVLSGALKEQGSQEQIVPPTLKFSAIFLSTTKSETKLAEVKIVTQPFHSIKKPVHAKIRLSPACHNFGHQ